MIFPANLLLLFLLIMDIYSSIFLPVVDDYIYTLVMVVFGLFSTVYFVFYSHSSGGDIGYII